MTSRSIAKPIKTDTCFIRWNDGGVLAADDEMAAHCIGTSPEIQADGNTHLTGPKGRPSLARQSLGAVS
jgi:hypothetical protein